MNADCEGISAAEYEARRVSRIAVLSLELTSAKPRRAYRKPGTDMRLTATQNAASMRRRAERESLPRRDPVPNGQGVRKPVVIWGVRYPSIRAAARATGLHFRTLHERLRRENRLRGEVPKWPAWDVNVATTG